VPAQWRLLAQQGRDIVALEAVEVSAGSAALEVPEVEAVQADADTETAGTAESELPDYRLV
jgi:hypothetical protein